MGGGGLEVPGSGSALDEQAVAFAAELIDRSGKAPVIEAALAHRTGRRLPAAGARRAHRLVVPGPGRPAAVPDRGHPAAVLPAIPGLPAPARRHRHCCHPADVQGCLSPGPVLFPRDLVRRRPLGAAEEPAAHQRRAQRPHPAHDPRSGHRRPEPARGAGQRAAGGQRLGPHRRRARRLRRLHRPGRHPGPAVQPRPVQACRAVRQRPRRRLVRPRGRPPRTRRRHRQAAAEDRLGAGGHHRRHRPAPRRRRPPRRTWPSAWP